MTTLRRPTLHRPYAPRWAALRRWWGPWAGVRLGLALLGVVPIATLCLALLDLLPLHLSTVFVVLPAVGLALGLGLGAPAVGGRALDGWLVGILATLLYDAFRLAGVALGLWHDFIPVIGQLAMGNPLMADGWGYLWRFALNDGAMAMTFAMLPPAWRRVRAGVLFGVSIYLCLFATLLLSPLAQTLLFPLTPVTILLALTGHAIYGASCAVLLRALERRAALRVTVVYGR